MDRNEYEDAWEKGPLTEAQAAAAKAAQDEARPDEAGRPNAPADVAEGDGFEATFRRLADEEDRRNREERERDAERRRGAGKQESGE